MTPPDGPPVCTALNFLPLGMPPPMPKMISRSVVPIRHFGQAGVADFAGEREDLGALGLLGAERGDTISRPSK